MNKLTKIIILFLMLWFAMVLMVGVYFKLTHIPGADYMLAIGFGGVVLVLFFVIVYMAINKKNGNKEK